MPELRNESTAQPQSPDDQPPQTDCVPHAAAAEHLLKGARVALTGRFALMTQRELAKLVVEFGGEHVSQPGRHTRWLVVGSGGPPLGADGQPPQALTRARQLRTEGYSIEIIQEEAFLDQLQLTEGDGNIRQRYTVAQLSRILDVSRDRIRQWVRWGLIEPVETVHRLDFFDFQQVTSAKVLCDLVTEGLPLAKIRESLHRIQGWLPGMESPLGQLSVLEETGRLLVRLDDGRLAESTGQLQLDFEATSDELHLPLVDTKNTDQWFQDALACENEGDYRGAAHCYQQAIDQEPSDPILHFNLGNVLYAAQQLDEAQTHFREAVSLDANYVEAWNNLGTVLADQKRYDECVQVFETALEVFPLYADAHFNLGDVYSAQGDHAKARAHWQRYLQLDPRSPWAADVEMRLGELDA